MRGQSAKEVRKGAAKECARTSHGIGHAERSEGTLGVFARLRRRSDVRHREPRPNADKNNRQLSEASESAVSRA